MSHEDWINGMVNEDDNEAADDAKKIAHVTFDNEDTAFAYADRILALKRGDLIWFRLSGTVCRCAKFVQYNMDDGRIDVICVEDGILVSGSIPISAIRLSPSNRIQ